MKFAKSTDRRGSYLIRLLILIRLTHRDSAYRWHPDPSFYHGIRNIIGPEHSPWPSCVQSGSETRLFQCRIELVHAILKDHLLFHLLHSYLYLFIINILIIPTSTISFYQYFWYAWSSSLFSFIFCSPFYWFLSNFLTFFPHLIFSCHQFLHLNCLFLK